MFLVDEEGFTQPVFTKESYYVSVGLKTFMWSLSLLALAIHLILPENSFLLSQKGVQKAEALMRTQAWYRLIILNERLFQSSGWYAHAEMRCLF